MTNRINLKVSEVTHEAIKAEQQDNETIDDTLRRVLGLTSTVDDIEHGIAAYLTDQKRTQVRELSSFISGLGDFEQTTEQGGGPTAGDVLRFISRDSGLTVAQLECSENGYTVYYRDSEGNMSTVSGGVYDADEVEMKKMKERTRECIEGAERRWGKRNSPR